MDHKTIIKTAPHGNRYNLSEKLDEFWVLIEDQYEEDWRLDANGDMLLEVDDAMLEKILTDNPATAWYAFGANRGGLVDGKKFFHDLPEYLKGTYTIKGVYSPITSNLIPRNKQNREYFFVQEGA